MLSGRVDALTRDVIVRLRSDYTARQLAKASGFSYGTVNRIQLGKQVETSRRTSCTVMNASTRVLASPSAFP